jgi:hypothetical protein
VTGRRASGFVLCVRSDGCLPACTMRKHVVAAPCLSFSSCRHVSLCNSSPTWSQPGRPVPCHKVQRSIQRGSNVLKSSEAMATGCHRLPQHRTALSVALGDAAHGRSSRHTIVKCILCYVLHVCHGSMTAIRDAYNLRGAPFSEWLTGLFLGWAESASVVRMLRCQALRCKLSDATSSMS